MEQNISILMLSLPLSDIRTIKRAVRTLGGLGVYSFDAIITEMVLGCVRKREDRRAQRETDHRNRWAARA